MKKGEEYTLTIKTLVNGQTVGQITEKFNTNKLKNLLVKELSAEKETKNEEEEETPAPKEEKEEDNVEDSSTTSGVKDETFWQLNFHIFWNKNLKKKDLINSSNNENSVVP